MLTLGEKIHARLVRLKYLTEKGLKRLRIREWVRDAFALDEDSAVMVMELRCGEPNCPPIETVIAIMGNGANRQYKVHKRLGEVLEEDVQSLAGRL